MTQTAMLAGFAHSMAGAVHAILAILCIGVGLIQFLRAKRGIGHRARGYLYVYGMLVTDGTALLVYQFTGRFNMFHIGAIANFICIVLAVIPLLRNPRPSNWKLRHYSFIAWSYVSLMSAASTEILIRVAPPMTRGQVGWMALAASISAMTIGYLVISRNRPPSDTTPTTDVMAAQGGVPS